MPAPVGAAQVRQVEAEDNRPSIPAVLRALKSVGVASLLIEGGGITVSRFLAAGALDRLQITVAPVILGSGRPGIVLPEIADLLHALRPRTRRFELGEDIMIECDFHER